jgi:hypothetical protein
VRTLHQRIRRQVTTRLTRLIENLVDVARVRAEEATADPPIDIHECLQQGARKVDAGLSIGVLNPMTLRCAHAYFPWADQTPCVARPSPD